MDEDFKEIGHTGGQVTFNVVTGPNGDRAFNVSWTHARPVPAALFAVYALPQGLPVAFIRMGGIGTPWDPPPFRGCYPVFIASDSEGRFGFQCPRCGGYWRANAGAAICPYCGLRPDKIALLTNAQRRYVAQYCARLTDALADEQDGAHVIDMDAVAEAAGTDVEKPPFYYAEESQQTKFTCNECGGFNDILGNFAFCSICGTHNGLADLEDRVIRNIRSRLNSTTDYEACVRDIASAFDSFVAQYVKRLTANVPLSKARRNRFEAMRFHNLQAARDEISASFDIDLFKGLKSFDVKLGILMFCRRHVYEHNGGEADERYLAESGDTGAKLKQALRETKESGHDFASLVARIARNLHEGFHELLPPSEEPIKRHTELKAYMRGASR